MIKCKITVIERTFNEKLSEKYVKEGKKKNFGPCDVFKEGQEFITDVYSEIPSGFCPWAWTDLYKSLVGLASGGNYKEWYENPNQFIACCTDGIKPVIFKIEKIEE